MNVEDCLEWNKAWNLERNEYGHRVRGEETTNVILLYEWGNIL